MPKLRLLMLEDSADDARLIKAMIKRSGLTFTVKLVSSRQDFINALDSFAPQFVLSDHRLPDFTSIEALKIVRKKFPNIPFILITGTVSEEFAVEIIKAGADDYILKDRLTRLPAAIKSVLRQHKANKEIADYKYALDQSSIISITDQKGIIIYTNENFCRISKYSAKELLGQDHDIINSGHHPASYIKNLWKTIANGKIWRGEFCNQAKDGSIYWVDATIVPFLNAAGKPYQYLAIRQDITEDKKREQELQDAHRHLLFHVENAPLGYIEWDNQLRAISWSKRAEAIFGWTEEEFIKQGKVGYSLVYEEDQAWVNKIAKQLISGQVERNSVQQRNYRKDGTAIWCEWFNSVLKDESGKVITIMSLVQDISESKKAEEYLRQSELRLNEAQAIAHISNWEVDLGTGMNTWSDEFFRIYGLKKGKVKPSTELFLSLMHPDDLAFCVKQVEEAFVTSADSSFNFRFIRIDGAIRHGHTEWRFEFDKKGNPVRLFGVLQDITERKEAEENLRVLEKQILDQKVQQQKKIARAIIKAQEKERGYIGRELHDNITQILAGAKMYMGIAGNRQPSMKESIKYPMELIENAIHEIRLLSSKMVAPVGNINLKDIIGQLLVNLEATEALHTSFVYKIDLEIDNDLKLNIYRIIQEQIHNIIKHAESKNITISIKTEKKDIEIVIADDGKGFDTNKKRAGIGISNMADRVESFNGTLSIISSAGQGCKIQIRIPIEHKVPARK